jgi:uncharacterized protein YndB with AHSA1/START domain
VNDRYGRLVLDGEQATLVFVRHLPYPIEAVWSALTDPDRRAAWFGETTLDGRVGGVIDLVPSGPRTPVERKRMTGRILVWDPPHVLEHEWQQAVAEDGVVRYELARDGNGTVLTFSHRGLGVPTAKSFGPGTHAFLDRLEAHLAQASPPDWIERYREVAGGYPHRP